MNYIIENLSIDNVEYYARVSALAWKQSYKGIINDEFLELINTEEEIQKNILKLKDSLNENTGKFLLKYNNKYVGIVRVRKSKYEKYSECGELGALYLLDEAKGKGFGKILFNKAISELKKLNYNKMIIGCLSLNPSNDFYKHMGGELIDNNPFTLPNGQELMENLYLYKIS